MCEKKCVRNLLGSLWPRQVWVTPRFPTVPDLIGCDRSLTSNCSNHMRSRELGGAESLQLSYLPLDVTSPVEVAPPPTLHPCRSSPSPSVSPPPRHSMRFCSLIRAASLANVGAGLATASAPCAVGGRNQGWPARWTDS